MITLINKLFENLSPVQIIVLCVLIVFTSSKFGLEKLRFKFSKRSSKKISSEDNNNVEGLYNVEESNENENFISPLPENIKHIPYIPSKFNEKEMYTRSCDFLTLMNSRRTVRFFSSDPVPKDVMYNIIKTAGTSPSGAHTEPWTFVLVKDSDIKQEIRKIVEDEEYVNYSKRMGVKWTTDLKPFKTNWEKPYLTEAPYIILVFKQLYSFTEEGVKKIHYYNEISIAIASGLLIAAIHYAGLCTLTSTPLNCGVRLRQLLKRPASEKLILLFPVGYPAKDCTVPDLSRKSFEDICVEF